MPTTAKSSSTLAKLGDLSTYSISTAAIPHDIADSSGAVPTVNATMADGTDTDYLIGESFSLSNPAIGKLNGEIVGLSSGTNSARYTISAETILSRLNSEQRLYPSQPFSNSTRLPVAALDYWSQQCGVFYDNVEGDVLFYQSQYIHWFAFAKGITKPIRGNNYSSGNGEDIGFASLEDERRVTTFGKDSDMVVDFPEGSRLPLLIPSSSDPNLLVLGTNVLNEGTGRKASITWNFETPTQQKVAVRLLIDSNGDISLQRSEPGEDFTTFNSVPGAADGNYRISVGLTSFSATETTFKLGVLRENGTSVGATTSNLTSAIKGGLSLTSVVYRGENQGDGSSQLHWGDSISVMAAMPTARAAVQKSFVTGPKGATHFTGFSGNVWENIKAYCSLYHLDVSYKDTKFTVEPRQTETTYVQALGTQTKSISKREQARFVEVVNRNGTNTGEGGFIVPQVMWKADTVYQVAVGEVQEFTVQTEHSILGLSQPIAVSGINPFPYKAGVGQYVVTGSDGYIVSPDFWRDQGGKVTVETTDTDGEIKVIIKGPDYDSPRAPYRISEGDAGRPALYVSGEGIINKPVTLRVGTGNSKAAKDVGTKVESPFIGDADLAYSAGARAALKYSKPEVTVTYIEALDYDKPSDLGLIPAGQLIKRDGNILRITDATQTPATISGNMSQHNTIAQVKKSYAGATIAEAKAYRAGKTIGQNHLKPLKVVK